MENYRANTTAMWESLTVAMHKIKIMIVCAAVARIWQDEGKP